MRHRPLLALLLTASLGVVLSAAPPANAAGQGDLAKVRALTAKYHDPAAAVRDGYAATSQCVPGMGYHYVKPAYSTAANAMQPTVMLYATRGGQLHLVAVEWVVFDADQDMEADETYSLFGQTFHGPMTHGIRVHRELHAWIWLGNPDGLFAQTNSKVTCP